MQFFRRLQPVADHEIDLSRHIVAHTLPAPGGMAELEELIGEVAGTPLDRSRPLWEMHVCQGLPDDQVAVVVKMHHALADGNAANALLGNVTDAPPEDAVLATCLGVGPR